MSATVLLCHFFNDRIDEMIMMTNYFTFVVLFHGRSIIGPEI